MKKIVLISLLATVFGNMAFAQKTTYKMQEVQARLLDVQSNAYVKPLTVELKVDETKGRIRDKWMLTKEQAETEMKGEIVNIRSYGVYMSSKKHDADVIVAATFNLRTTDDGSGYELEVVGFPARFFNWKTATPADYDWIRMEKTITTADRDKISAIVK
ncbi:MAG TPA: hypothetical protein PLN34_06055 [Alloprevotella sp.]|nr:hypothetical protein [Alloprevotella sp.]